MIAGGKLGLVEGWGRDWDSGAEVALIEPVEVSREEIEVFAGEGVCNKGGSCWLEGGVWKEVVGRSAGVWKCR